MAMVTAFALVASEEEAGICPPTGGARAVVLLRSLPATNRRILKHCALSAGSCLEIALSLRRVRSER